jgi:hypothetical protein
MLSSVNHIGWCVTVGPCTVLVAVAVAVAVDLDVTVFVAVAVRVTVPALPDPLDPDDPDPLEEPVEEDDEPEDEPVVLADPPVEDAADLTAKGFMPLTCTVGTIGIGVSDTVGDDEAVPDPDVAVAAEAEGSSPPPRRRKKPPAASAITPTPVPTAMATVRRSGAGRRLRGDVGDSAAVGASVSGGGGPHGDWLTGSPQE